MPLDELDSSRVQRALGVHDLARLGAQEQGLKLRELRVIHELTSVEYARRRLQQADAELVTLFAATAHGKEEIGLRSLEHALV